MTPTTAAQPRTRPSIETSVIYYHRTPLGSHAGANPARGRHGLGIVGDEAADVGCPSEARTLVDVLRHRAEHQAGMRAYTFLLDGDGREANVTYGELDHAARAIAATLQGQVEPGARALLMYPPGLTFVAAFLGCLYAGVVPVPLNPPRSNRHAGRVRAVVADAKATLALTDSASRAKIEQALAEDGPGAAFPSCRVLATDTIDASAAERWREVPLAPDAPAFLQYTSGSTGVPKGVVVTHANIMANEAAISAAARLQPGDVSVIWLPMFHDMGLIGGVLNPLYAGYRCVLMAPTHFLQDPMRWLRAISQYRGTLSAAPNFAYELCLKAAATADLDALDLSSWRVGLNGAEPVRAETLERFSETFAPCGFRAESHYPSYGLAEATLLVTGGTSGTRAVVMDVDADALAEGRAARAASGKSRRLVGCGKAINSRVVIAHPDTGATRRAGEVGEIWVSGPSIAAGYWGRPEESERTFGAHLSDTGEGPFLRTGDLGFLTEDGELFVTGRCKDLVVIRGRNIYPQDVELAIERVATFIRPNTCAVFSVEVDGEEALGAVIEADRALAHQLAAEQRDGVEDLIARIRQAVAEEFEVTLHTVGVMKPGSFPRTSSGKVQRSACKRELEEGRENTLYVSRRAPRAEPVARRETAPTGVAAAYDRRQGSARAEAVGIAADTTNRVKRVIAEVCGIPVATIREEAFLIAYDIDSLRKVELLLALEEAFGIEASENDPRLHEVRTVRELVAFVAGLREETLRSAA